MENSLPPHIDSDHPFLKPEMFKLWESSGLTTEHSDWKPHYFTHGDGFTFAYEKEHSYGEFIFDWAWADLFHRFGVPYYPKLVQAVPVTPVSAPKFIHPSAKLYQKVWEHYQEQNYSSHHILFSEPIDFFSEKDYFYQKTLQFHFINRFTSFDDFLNKLKARKRKNIIKERKAVSQYPIQIKKIAARDVPSYLRTDIYNLYLGTITKKFSQAYLSHDWFLRLEQGFYYLAFINEQIIAMSLFFEGENILYGRYWGIHPKLEREYSFLHFEMCYYLGIEHTIENHYKKFEAGAQGEQKLLRGFNPVEIGSLHHIKHPQFRVAIKNFIDQQNSAYTEEIERLKAYLPYKGDL